MQVFDANSHIIDDLKAATRGEQGRVNSVSRRHGAAASGDLRPQLPALLAVSQPADLHGRVSSWFVDVTAIKDRMLEHNQEITWVPGGVRDGQFGKWLARAPATGRSPVTVSGVVPVPVWKSDDPAYPADRRLRFLRRAGAGLRPCCQDVWTDPDDG